MPWGFCQTKNAMTNCPVAARSASPYIGGAVEVDGVLPEGGDGQSVEPRTQDP